MAATLLLASCSTTGAGIESGCEWARPILVSRDDALTADTARQILAHNRAGARICGWRPGG